LTPVFARTIVGKTRWLLCHRHGWFSQCHFLQQVYAVSYGFDFDNLWFYVHDNGSYASNEWINDNGTWYWLDESGELPISAGISKDGYLYNDDGIYVPLNDGQCHFVNQDMYNLLQVNMTADQVVSILGQPHYLEDTYTYSSVYSNHTYVTYEWYTEGAKGEVLVHFDNGRVSDFWAYWN